MCENKCGNCCEHKCSADKVNFSDAYPKVTVVEGKADTSFNTHPNLMDTSKEMYDFLTKRYLISESLVDYLCDKNSVVNKVKPEKPVTKYKLYGDYVEFFELVDSHERTAKFIRKLDKINNKRIYQKTLEEVENRIRDFAYFDLESDEFKIYLIWQMVTLRNSYTTAVYLEDGTILVGDFIKSENSAMLNERELVSQKHPLVDGEGTVIHLQEFVRKTLGVNFFRELFNTDKLNKDFPALIFQHVNDVVMKFREINRDSIGTAIDNLLNGPFKAEIKTVEYLYKLVFKV